jgi:RNA 2',3'-cyclic 3'-phosphodiesterase
MKRIFIAIKVDAGNELLKMISSFKEVMRSDSVKWTHIDNIHITLVFLGDTPEDIINAVCQMLSEKCQGSGSFSLLLKGCGIFRNLSDPRIIWTGIQPSDRLNALNASIISGLRGLKIRLEDRPFNPHLTIGRIKHINDSGMLESLVVKYKDSELQIVQVNEVILYESILLPSGPVYKPLAKFSLD